MACFHALPHTVLGCYSFSVHVHEVIFKPPYISLIMRYAQ